MSTLDYITRRYILRTWLRSRYRVTDVNGAGMNGYRETRMRRLECARSVRVRIGTNQGRISHDLKLAKAALSQAFDAVKCLTLLSD